MLKKSALLLRLLVSAGMILTTLPFSLFLTPSHTALAEVVADEPPPPESELLPEVPAAVAPAAPAQTSPVTHTIYLQSREFIPAEPDVQALQRLAIAGRDRVHVLLQLDFIPRQAAKAEYEARGVKLLAYVPDYAWIASVPAADPASALQLPGVTWAGALTVEDKLSPDIVKDAWGSYNLAPDGTAAVYVALHADVSLEAGRRAVAGYGGRITGEVTGINMLVVEMPRANIEALAAEDIVQWIEPAAPPLTESNDGIRPQIGVDVVQAAPYNLDGTGVDVLVYDSGQAGAHVDFGSRLTIGAGDSAPVREHSTHVAGTVGGDGSNSASQGGSSYQWRGMATNVDIISYGYEWDESGILFYSNPGDIETDWARAQNWYGADIGTASLGSNIYYNYAPTYCYLMGNYGDTSVLIDQIVRGGNSTVGIGDKYIATWAAGNERGWTTSCGTYSIVAPPAAAKNPIHVGGSNTNNNTQYAHTSWGPTDDGRIKPIVTAGACQTSGDFGITSTDNNPVNDYTSMCGTSMATPAVAGGIALMLQHYRDVYNTSGNFWPSTAKAILIHTADDFGNPGPDYQWGFGQVDIHAAVDLISRKAFRQESIAQDEVDVYYFIVPDADDNPIVTLAWDDFEATFNANPTLINNLDLELESPSGAVVRPWILNPASPATNATRGVDSVNNQEQVLIPDADMEVGTWLVRVSAPEVPEGPQDYTLVCEGCKPLDLGVCQDTVATLQAVANGTDVPGLDGLRVPAEIVLTAGELWQQSLEATPDDGSLVETESALQRLAVAQEQGPEAVLALADTLTGAARDLAMEETIRAREQILEAAPPPPDVPAISARDEAAALAAQEARALANRETALRVVTDPAEGKRNVMLSALPPIPDRPVADLTVGNGCAYATIGAAIAAAIPGDRILIEGGRTFVENITIPITLTVEGGYPGCASGSSAPTTLDGNASGPVVIVDRAIEVSLEFLNITNGNTGFEGGGIRFAWGDGTGLLYLTNIDIYGNQGSWGGGLWVGLDADVIGDNVYIYNNTATTYGGGVRLFGGRATFSNSNVYGNSAPYGAGIYATLQEGFAPRIDLPTYADVYQNTATTGASLGGGIYLREGTVALADCSDVYSNQALTGGGVYMITSTLTIEGYCSEIYNNTATNDGGGIYAQGSTINLDNDAELYSNDATTGDGGGAYLDNSDLWSDKALIWYNTAAGYGGGVYANNGSLVDMDIDAYTCVGVRCSRLYYNTASGGYGGAIYSFESTVDLRNTFVERNTAVLGGALYAYDSPVYLYNNLVAGNNATSTAGDGIRVYIDSVLYGNNNTLAYNDANYASTGRAVDIYNGDITLGCSVIWGHTSSINETGHTVTYSDIQGGYVGDGNLMVTPGFVSVGSRDFHLQESSPLIDRCITGSSPDFDNEMRPIVRHTAASPYDMGADEVSGVMRVGLNGNACAYSTIQQAIHAAVDGDTVQVAEGVYFENLSASSKDITIAGGYDSTCIVTGTTATRIEGSVRSSNVAYVYNSDLTLRNLELAWGSGTGAGLYATTNSHVTLDNADLTDNHGGTGGGFYVSGSSSLTSINGSAIHENTATTAGGGGRLYGQLTATDASIYGNCAAQGGGLYLDNGSQAALDAAVVYGNEAASTSGGGIYATLSTVNLESTQVGLNSAVDNGGGLYLTNNSTLYAHATDIGFPLFIFSFGNQAGYGGGLYAENSTVDFEGNVRLNRADYAGGGIYASGGALTLNNSAIGYPYGNGLGEYGYFGSGLYLTNAAHATLSATTVASNTFQSAWGYGGGAYLIGGSYLTLTNDSLVAYHTTPSGGSSRGAGIYADSSTVTLDASRVMTNTSDVGGGVRLWNDNTLNVRNGAQIVNNHAIAGAGGGIAAGSGASDINIDTARLVANTASTDGGALYANAGTVDFTGGWTLYGNTSGGNGGAVAIAGIANAYFNAGAYSLVYYNRALGGHGGMVYLANNTTAELHATSGAQMYVYANHASGNGGALYADNGGYFDVYGQVNFERNRADNGGAVYLANASRVWLDDYSNVKPQLWDNWADYGSGGAVYASNSPNVRCDGAILGKDNDGNHAAVDGGALYLSGSILSAENCIFQDNLAATHGGAIAAYTSTLTLRANYGSSMNMVAGEPDLRDGLAPLAPAATACDPTLELCSAFFENVADSDGDSSGDGGAIYNSDGAFTIKHTMLYTNTAYRGGAIYQTGTNASAQVENTLIYSNTVSLALGAGIRSNGGTFSVTHATIANNIGGAGYSQSSTTGEVHNSIAWGNTNGGFWVSSGTLTGTCNLDQSGNAGPAIDPRFVDAANQDFHLLGDSPAIDACATGLSPDLDNVPRPVATAYDMGVYEYPYGVSFTPDHSGIGYPEQDVLYTHTLINTGGINDTFTLSGLSSHGWSLTFPPSVPLNAGQSVPVEVTVHVPAGILSGTVDTAVITATSDADTTLSAHVVDTTTIGFAPDVSFVPDHTTTSAAEGSLHTYIHTLTNTGNAQDTFSLSFSSSAGWGNLVTTGPFILNPGTSTSVVYTVTVPLGGGGLSDTSLITATSDGGAGPAVVHDITSAFIPGSAFTPDHEQTVSQGTVLTYTHLLTNTGNATDTFHLTTINTTGWSTLVDLGPFTLVPDEAQSVRVRVTVPPGSGGMMDTTWVTATSSGGADPVGVRDTTTVFMPGLAFTPDYIETIPTNSAITYTHRLTNTGADADTFDVGLASSSEGWATLVDSGPFALSAGAATDVRVRVEAPDGSGGLTDVAVITATSRAGSLSGLSAMVTDTTTAIRTYGVGFAPNHAQSINPGDAITYTHWLTNTGSGTDQFALALNSSRGWATLLDPGPFDLDASASVAVQVRVDVPLGSGGLVDVARVVATSQLSPTVSATVTDTTTSIYGPGTTLIPDHSQSVAPGTMLTYTHWLTNSGNGSDQFVLDFASSEGWATLLDTGPFSLDAGEGVTLNVRVNVPAGSGGLVDTSVLTATSQTGGLSALATDTTSAIHTPGVDIAPDYAQSVVPEGTFIYVHTLDNTGDGFDTFSITLTSSAGWATLLDPGPFALGVGESAEVRVSVLVPSGLISGTASDVAVVTATSYANPAVQDTATDTTVVGYAPGALFERDNLTVGALPNDTMIYTHWLTNTGNYTDTFEAAFNSRLGWGTLLDTGPFALGVDESATVRVQVDVPPDGSGKFDSSVVTITSQAGVGPLMVRDTTAAFAPGVALAPDYLQSADPGDVFTLTHTLTNTGAFTDTFRLIHNSTRGWSTLLDTGPYTLLPDEAIAVRVVVTVPLGAGGLVDVTTLDAASLDGWGPSARVTDTTMVTYLPGIALTPDHVDAAPAGSAIIYTHLLTNTGNGPDTFSVMLHSSLGWGALLDPGPFDLAADGSTEIRVEVTVPTDTLISEVDTTVITATSLIGALSDQATDITSVVCEPVFGANFTFAPSPAQTSQPVMFTGTVAGGSLPIAYLWNFGDATSEQSDNPVTHVFATENTFTVWMTATNTCPSVVTTTRQVAVAAYPDITVTPLFLVALLQPDSTVTQTLTLGNVGDADLTWSLTEVITATWLSELPTGGVIIPAGNTPIDVVFDATGLVSGTFTTTLRIASTDPDESIVDVRVTLAIGGNYIYLPLVLRND